MKKEDPLSGFQKQILMIKQFVSFLLLTITWNVFAQQEPCYFDSYLRSQKNRIIAAEKVISNEVKNPAKSSHGIKTIPVVVHVIHNNGTENISDAQILSQIEVLNEDFRKMPGTLGDGNGVDTEIEFCLAKISPDGDCTDGIVRVRSTLTNHLTYQRAQLKELSYWDNTRYLNMYVVKSINEGSGIAGYASFPGGPPEEDGIVVRHNYFGKTGTASSTLGRTTTHEIAHWFGLYHTFQDGCQTDLCSEGDLVCDTPPVALPNFNCPVVNSCSNDTPDVNDQVENYLDYTDDNCKNMFTDGQKQRMQATLNTFRTDIWSESNLISTGCDANYIPPSICPLVADFTALNTEICVNGVITFYNRSLNGPASFVWTLPGATPSTSTDETPTVIYSDAGIFPVKLVVSNSEGTDSLEIMNYVTVSEPQPGIVSSLQEGFESTIFPDNGITIDNPDNGITWERTTDAAYEGEASARIQNLINVNYGQSDAMMLPRMDFTVLTTPIRLKFKWAYARSSPTYSDELIVLVSEDCGNTWTQRFYRSGSSLASAPTQATLFIPDSSQWRSADVNLSMHANSDRVDIKIVNVTDGGNALYIDQITLNDAAIAGLEDLDGSIKLNVFPNPVKNELTVQLEGEQSGIDAIKIHDLLGKEYINLDIPSVKKQTVDVSELSSGVYIVSVVSGHLQSNLRFVKQ